MRRIIQGLQKEDASIRCLANVVVSLVEYTNHVVYIVGFLLSLTKDCIRRSVVTKSYFCLSLGLYNDLHLPVSLYHGTN